MNHLQQTRAEQQQQPLAETVVVASSNQPVNAYPDPTHQLSHQPTQRFHNQPQLQQLQSFWAKQLQEVELTTDFKNHSLPLARIKKIMKADEDVRMISAEAPVVFAKACEMFILELTLRSWIHTEESKRRTLQRNDIAAATSRTDVFDFLVDIIPRDELKDEVFGLTKAAIPFVGSAADSIPYYQVPAAQLAPSGMMMAKPVEQSLLFAGHQLPPPLSFVPWTHPVTTSTITSETQSQTGQSQPTTKSKETG